MLRKLHCPTKTVKEETSPSDHPEATLAVAFAPPELGPPPTATLLTLTDQDSLPAQPQVSHSRVSDILILNII